MTIKLSKPGKMPCPSWSLQAVATCPGARDPEKPGELVPACQGCYATDGNYRFKNVIAVREKNQDGWKAKNWISDMVSLIEREPFFRWFDSGDMYHIDLAEKIYHVMRATPGTQHWLPTRMAKFPKFRNVIARMQKLPNVVVRKSSDSITGATIRGRNTSTIFDPAQGAPDGAQVCPAYTRDGKCGDCRACWDKTVQVIAYPQHGRKMAAVNKNLIARAS